MPHPPNIAADSRHENRHLVISMLFAFVLMTAYSLLKPLRDEVASHHEEAISWLWSGTFLAMLAVVPLFGWASSRYSRRQLVPVVYRFFLVNLLIFYLLQLRLTEEGPARTSLDFVFYVWVSVFNLFALSLFWSFLADFFRSDQGRRLFGRVMMGATLGAISGPLLVRVLVEWLGAAHLLIISMVLLEVALWCFRYLDRSFDRSSNTEERRALGGRIWDGARTVFHSPYLRQICLYLLLFLVSGGFLYRLKATFAKEIFEDREARIAFFANIEIASNTLTLLLQFFVTGQLLQRRGVGFTLMIMPIATMFAFGALGAVTSLTTIAIADILRRAGNYALAKPAREVLFTVVPREQKYKSKSFIDTVIYRGGDSGVSWMYDLFERALNPSGLAYMVVPFAGLWALSGYRLGRGFQHTEDKSETTDESVGAGTP
ncbi:MAG: MFS transporter [Planctomycetota bacterium]|nr:MFS transporter [Planctomycetota bacterium]